MSFMLYLGEVKDMDIEKNKERFISLFETYIKRRNSEHLLNYLINKSDFFTAPASTRYHGTYEGGLCEHSLQVYDCLKDYLSRPRVKEIYELDVSEETIAIIALLHDLCKCNVYKTDTKNKKINGAWQQVPYYVFEDPFPYGHGEKSVFMIQHYIPLTAAEAMAIRYHMGFSSTESASQVGQAFNKYPLAFALSTADMEATYFLENIQKHEENNDE